MPADANANEVQLANQEVGTLTQPLDWFRAKSQRQDAEVDAREQVEHKLGQALSLDQHWMRFSRYLMIIHFIVDKLAARNYKRIHASVRQYYHLGHSLKLPAVKACAVPLKNP